MKKLLFVAFIAGILGANDELAPGFNDCLKSVTSKDAWLACVNKAQNHWQESLEKSYQNTIKQCSECSKPDVCKANVEQIKAKWQEHGGALNKLNANEGLKVLRIKQEAMYFDMFEYDAFCFDIGAE